LYIFNSLRRGRKPACCNAQREGNRQCFELKDVPITVAPANAGAQRLSNAERHWIPALAGTTAQILKFEALKKRGAFKKRKTPQCALQQLRRLASGHRLRRTVAGTYCNGEI
jgi:hypothetical protein